MNGFGDDVSFRLPRRVLTFLRPGSSPTTSTSEAKVKLAKSSMPWEGTDSGTGKYQYHPGGDTGAAAKDAPSAVNVVVVPDVNLPKVSRVAVIVCAPDIPLANDIFPPLTQRLHDKWNKWGKDGY